MGTDGHDVIFGTAGDDILDGGAGNDNLIDSAGNNSMRGGAGDDRIQAYSSGSNLVWGDAGEDRLEAGLGNATLDGGDGNDLLIAYLSGSGGSATAAHTVSMLGGAGNDWFMLHAQWALTVPASVSATGGPGQDLFFPHEREVYTVTDFQTGAGGDQISIHGFTGPGQAIGLTNDGNPFDSGLVSLQQSGADTLLRHKNSTLLVLANVNAASITIDNIKEAASPAGGLTGVTRHGDAGANEMVGGLVNDTLFGGAGADHIHGKDGDDRLHGEEGNDFLAGWGGNDLLDGGAGVDTAIFYFSSANYAITRSQANVTVTAVNSLEGSDTLSGIERISFSDKSFAFDLEGTAGQTYRLYQAAFARTPDAGGLGYWIAKGDAGMPLLEMTALFTQSAEFTALYGVKPGNAQMVTQFYQNILGRAPDLAGQLYWTDILDRQLAPASYVLAQFSESVENKAALEPLIGQGFGYSFWGSS